MNKIINYEEETIGMKVNPKDKELIRKAAKINRISMTGYILNHVIPAAKHDIEQASNYV